MSFELTPSYIFTNISATFQIYRPLFAIYRRFFRYIGASTQDKDTSTMFNTPSARKGTDRFYAWPDALATLKRRGVFLCRFFNLYVYIQKTGY